jgi:hypothetical protein
VFVDGVTDPVDSGVVSNGIVLGVNTDDFEIFMSSVFSDPIRVQNSHGGHGFTDSLFSSGSQRSLEFETSDSLTGGFTVNDTLGNGSLSSSSSDFNSIDDISLFSFIS